MTHGLFKYICIVRNQIGMKKRNIKSNAGKMMRMSSLQPWTSIFFKVLQYAIPTIKMRKVSEKLAHCVLQLVKKKRVALCEKSMIARTVKENATYQHKTGEWSWKQYQIGNEGKDATVCKNPWLPGPWRRMPLTSGRLARMKHGDENKAKWPKRKGYHSAVWKAHYS